MTAKAKDGTETTAELAVVTHEPTKEDEAIAAAVEKGKDYGDWEYKPWSGIDHWVHKVTGASTFNLNKIPASSR